MVVSVMASQRSELQGQAQQATMRYALMRRLWAGQLT